MEKNCKEEKKRKKAKGSNLFYDFVKITGAIPILLWLRPKVKYFGARPPKGGMLAMANHHSFRDPVMLLCIFWNRRIRSLATKDLYKNRILTFFFNKIHCIQVDKENFSLSSFHEVTKNLSEGRVVTIFPEGGLNSDVNSVKEFKSGAVLMAYKSATPILPIYIAKREHWYERSVAVIGEAVDVRKIVGDRPSLKAMEEANALLYQRELELKEFYEGGLKKSSEPVIPSAKAAEEKRD